MAERYLDVVEGPRQQVPLAGLLAGNRMTAPTDYYVSRRKKLLRFFDSLIESGRNLISDRYGDVGGQVAEGRVGQ